jgi:hypothetical protein
MLEFEDDKNETIQGVAEMPHGWKPGTAVYPHMHLRFPYSTTGTSSWKFEYDIADSNDPFTNIYGVYTTLSTITVNNPGNIKAELAVSFGPLPMVQFSESSIIMWKLTRLGKDNPNDTDKDNIALLSLDIQYLVEKLGTATMTPPGATGATGP